MEHLLLVGGVLATATFLTGLLLPVLARREGPGDDPASRDAALADELLGRR